MRIMLLLLWASCDLLRADSFMPSQPETFTSPSGKLIVRTVPADSVIKKTAFWSHTVFKVFSYNEEAEAFTRVRKFEVEGHPLRIFINDEGTRIVTIDQHFGAGQGQIAAIYDFDGTRLAQWTLYDIFDEMKTNPRSLFKFRQTTSSIFWRGEARWDYDQKKIQIDGPKDIEDKKDGTWVITLPSKEDSYEIDVEGLTMKRIPSVRKPEAQLPPDREQQE